MDTVEAEKSVNAKKAFLIVAVALLAACVAAVVYAAQQPSVTLKIYPDCSVQAIIAGSTVRENAPQGSISIDYEVLEPGLRVQASGDLVSKAGPAYPSYFTLDVEGVSETRSGEVKADVNLAFEVEGRDSKLKVVIADLRIESSRESLETVIEGSAVVTGEGEDYQKLIMVLPMLSKEIVEQQLAAANITWIRVEELSTTVDLKRGEATITFKLIVDGRRYAEWLAEQTNTTE